jgi:SAM-dependent methyltransferase
MIEESLESAMPLTGARWAAKSEAYAALVSEHLSDQTVWLDAGCGSRLLEEDTDSLESWLASRPKRIIGLDVGVTSHRNIKLLVRGSLYDLPFGDESVDLITCNMVVEHLEHPSKAFAEVFRCLRSSGAVVIHTPNLLHYAVMGNAMATKLLPEKWRLKIVQATDDRAVEDIFPVRYAANTMRRLQGMLSQAGLQVHRAIPQRQLRPFLRKARKLERLLMKLTPFSGLLVCAHKPSVS